LRLALVQRAHSFGTPLRIGGVLVSLVPAAALIVLSAEFGVFRTAPLENTSCGIRSLSSWFSCFAGWWVGKRSPSPRRGGEDARSPARSHAEPVAGKPPGLFRRRRGKPPLGGPVIGRRTSDCRRAPPPTRRRLACGPGAGRHGAGLIRIAVRGMPGRTHDSRYSASRLVRVDAATCARQRR